MTRNTLACLAAIAAGSIRLTWREQCAENWYLSLTPSERWRLDRIYAEVLHNNRLTLASRIAFVYTAEGNDAPAVPYGWFDPPSRCRCDECERMRAEFRT